MREHLGPNVRLLDTAEQIGDVVAEGSYTLARGLVADETRDEQAGGAARY